MSYLLGVTLVDHWGDFFLLFLGYFDRLLGLLWLNFWFNIVNVKLFETQNFKVQNLDHLVIFLQLYAVQN